MARKKRIRTVESNEEYLSQQDSGQQGQPSSEVQAQGEITLNSESPSGGVDVVIEDNEGIRRTRGKTLLCHLWQLPAGHRIVVQENSIFQPIGAEAGLLGQYLGTLARNGTICSLSYNDWKLLKKVALPNILFLIKEKFIYSSKCEKLILKSLNLKWNQHKSTLKNMYFDEHTPIDEMCKKVPEGVIADQWINLVLRWSSPEGKAISERNKKARAMQKTPHTAGTKSFARHAHEMKMKDPQKREPNRAEVYLVTHKHKDGSFVNDEVALAIQKQLEENPEAVSNFEGRVAWEGDALSQVLGKDKNGHVRGVGLIPDPKLVLQPTRHFEGMDTTMLDEKTLLLIVRELVRQIESFHEIVEELRSEINGLKYGASSTTTSGSAHDSPNEGIRPVSNASTHTDQSGFMNLLNLGRASCEFPDF